MKKTAVLLASFLVTQVALAQSGTSKAEAIAIQMKTDCAFETFASSASEVWFKFTPTTEHVQIELLSQKYGKDQAHIHNMSLFKSGSTEVLAEDELPFNAQAHRLSLDLNVRTLEMGITYYLRLDRAAHLGHCKRKTCIENAYANAASFELCVSSLEAWIPEDLNNEKPAAHFAYELVRGQITSDDGTIANQLLVHSKSTVPQLYLADQYAAFVWTKIDGDTSTVDSLQRIDMELVGAQMTSKFLRAEEYDFHNNHYTAGNPDGILGNKSYARIIRQEVYPGIDQHYYSNEKGLKQYFVVKSGAKNNQIEFHFTGAEKTELTPNGDLLIHSELGTMEMKRGQVYNINEAGNKVPMPASGRFESSGENRYRIKVEHYPLERPVIIQIDHPQKSATRGENNPEWSTYVGGDKDDYYTCIDAVVEGNMYVAGRTYSTDFPTNNDGIFSDGNKGFSDGMVSCFDFEHVKLWSTYFGGEGADVVLDIAHDAARDQTYVTGVTGSEEGYFASRRPLGNTTAYKQSFYATSNGDELGGVSFVSLLNNGGGLEWHTQFSTYVGPINDQNIKVDAAGNVFVGGTILYPLTEVNCEAPSNIGIFPRCKTTTGSFVGKTDNNTAYEDAFVAKFNVNHELVWSTLFGGEYIEEIFDLAIDPVNNKLYVVGATWTAGNDPATQNCPLNTKTVFPICNSLNYAYHDATYNGADALAGGLYQRGDGFIAQFDLDGRLEWSTFFGGKEEDFLTGVAVDEAGNLFVVGLTSSESSSNSCTAPPDGSIPLCNVQGGETPMTFHGGKNDILAAKFDADKNLLWSSYLGGGSGDSEETPRPYHTSGFPRISVNPKGDFYISGVSTSGSSKDYNSIQTRNNPDYYNQATHADYEKDGPAKTDHFVLHFTDQVELDWATYFGGKSNTARSEFAGDLVAKGNAVYLCGGTVSVDQFPYYCQQQTNQFTYCQPASAVTVNANNSDAFVAQLVLNRQLQLNELPKKQPLNLYPNPSGADVDLHFFSPAAFSDEVLIYNQLGQLICSEKIEAKTGNNEIRLQTESLWGGIYFVTFRKTSTYKVTKFVKL